jgi:hypothetical protein
MKRQVLMIALGSLLALPAFANDEIDAGNLPPAVETTKTREQVRMELFAAEREAAERAAVIAYANDEMDAGNLPPPVATTKTREQVRMELFAAERAGEMVENAELGT